ncbi:Uncharacterized protein L484_016973 [Morus notabilis]|uniref:Mitochondrial acidic protein MAM33 n=1 Tax=Morus notabilis TaxID=981085 RepID=W9QQU7_9ROSA|nr:uncharacterized protein At2g39795, mitochondrial [Morus notabilis]EXB36722.1 Uncharacterized protein L484_016973 [Morus notabilis]
MAQAFYSVLRRASSSVLPVAIRTAGASRTFHAAAAATLQKGNLSRDLTRGSFVPFLRFSSESAAKRRADENLLQVVESEIECAEETEDQNTMEKIPKGFLFKIKDNPGERTILLKRKFEDEIIKVEVDMPDVSGDDEDEDEEDGKDDAVNFSIPLVVSISKGNGVQLEFGVTAFPSEITIDSLSIEQPDDSLEGLSYEGPEFNDLDENLQKAFHNYLEVRGIEQNITNFLHQYMIAKDSKEYMNWLKNLKDFVEH